MYSNRSLHLVQTKEMRRFGDKGVEGARGRDTRDPLSCGGEVADWYLFKEQVNSGSWLVTYECKEILQLTTNGTSTTSINREKERKKDGGGEIESERRKRAFKSVTSTRDFLAPLVFTFSATRTLAALVWVTSERILHGRAFSHSRFPARRTSIWIPATRGVINTNAGLKGDLEMAPARRSV